MPTNSSTAYSTRFPPRCAHRKYKPIAPPASEAAVGEFDLIERFFHQTAAEQPGPGVALGIGDDCALLDLPAGQQLAVSADTLVAGVHFPQDATPAEIAE